MTSRYASRKFIVSMFVLVSADVLVVIGSITASVWAAAVGSVVAAYVAANVGQKVFAKDEQS